MAATTCSGEIRPVHDNQLPTRRSRRRLARVVHGHVEGRPPTRHITPRWRLVARKPRAGCGECLVLNLESVPEACHQLKCDRSASMLGLIVGVARRCIGRFQPGEEYTGGRPACLMDIFTLMSAQHDAALVVPVRCSGRPRDFMVTSAPSFMIIGAPRQRRWTGYTAMP